MTNHECGAAVRKAAEESAKRDGMFFGYFTHRPDGSISHFVRTASYDAAVAMSAPCNWGGESRSPVDFPPDYL